MPPKVTANNLKAEILDAYNEVYEEHEQLQKQFDKLAKEKKRPPCTCPRPSSRRPRLPASTTSWRP
jgi:hypothetical protein